MGLTRKLQQVVDVRPCERLAGLLALRRRVSRNAAVHIARDFDLPQATRRDAPR